ncbi:hypothetical protein KAX17_09945, partial [Candidatus Bipolaricaulota bacterium]|nr:hypothetical protein [Candidatus Bipolaricaulota bacterium]
FQEQSAQQSPTAPQAAVLHSHSARQGEGQVKQFSKQNNNSSSFRPSNSFNLEEVYRNTPPVTTNRPI